ncbi:hypothetical protein FVE85_6608 [Porphyridium purpureum]|uniref:Tbc2 translation factor, chloroplastic n=1 Tax=Porphyridium purpureum TaxID=35688 RepID=A0A5J4Z868_PORPP|nr:hypothetical protein FVE85_6608 [Porphyridium purpureum]|eukprot:POR8653..scf295_1
MWTAGFVVGVARAPNNARNRRINARPARSRRVGIVMAVPPSNTNARLRQESQQNGSAASPNQNSRHEQGPNRAHQQPIQGTQPGANTAPPAPGQGSRWSRDNNASTRRPMRQAARRRIKAVVDREREPLFTRRDPFKSIPEMAVIAKEQEPYRKIGQLDRAQVIELFQELDDYCTEYGESGDVAATERNALELLKSSAVKLNEAITFTPRTGARLLHIIVKYCRTFPRLTNDIREFMVSSGLLKKWKERSVSALQTKSYTVIDLSIMIYSAGVLGLGEYMGSTRTADSSAHTLARNDFLNTWFKSAGNLYKFNAQALSNTIYGFARLEIQPPREFIMNFCWMFTQTVRNMNAQALTNCIWSFAKLGILPTDAVLDAWREQYNVVRLQSCSAQARANSLWALASLNLAFPSTRFFSAFETRVFLATWVKDFLEVKDQFRAQELANSIWALGRLDVTLSDDFVQAWYTCFIAQARHFAAQELGSSIMGCALLRLRPSELWIESWQQRSQAVPTSNFGPQELANSLWAFAQMDIHPGELWLEWWLQRAQAEIEADGFILSELSSIMWAIYRLEVFRANHVKSFIVSCVNQYISLLQRQPASVSAQSLRNSISAICHFDDLDVSLARAFERAWVDAFRASTMRRMWDFASLCHALWGYVRFASWRDFSANGSEKKGEVDLLDLWQDECEDCFPKSTVLIDTSAEDSVGLSILVRAFGRIGRIPRPWVIKVWTALLEYNRSVCVKLARQPSPEVLIAVSSGIRLGILPSNMVKEWFELLERGGVDLCSYSPAVLLNLHHAAVSYGYAALVPASLAENTKRMILDRRVSLNGIDLSQYISSVVAVQSARGIPSEAAEMDQKVLTAWRARVYDEALPLMSTQSLSTCLWASATLDMELSEREWNAWMSAFMAHGRAHISAQSLSLCMWACARYGRRPNDDFVEFWKKRVLETQSEMHAQTVSNVLWSCAKLAIPCDDDFIVHLLDRFETCPDANVCPQALANVLWAVAKINSTGNIDHPVAQQSLAPQSPAATFWSLWSRRFMVCESMDPLSLGGVMWAFPRLLRACASTTEENTRSVLAHWSVLALEQADHFTVSQIGGMLYSLSGFEPEVLGSADIAHAISALSNAAASKCRAASGPSNAGVDLEALLAFYKGWSQLVDSPATHPDILEPWAKALHAKLEGLNDRQRHAALQTCERLGVPPEARLRA